MSYGISWPILKWRPIPRLQSGPGWLAVNGSPRSAIRYIRTVTQGLPICCSTCRRCRERCVWSRQMMARTTGIAPNIDFALLALEQRLPPSRRRGICHLRHWAHRRMDCARAGAVAPRHVDPPACASTRQATQLIAVSCQHSPPARGDCAAPASGLASTPASPSSPIPTASTRWRSTWKLLARYSTTAAARRSESSLL